MLLNGSYPEEANTTKRNKSRVASVNLAVDQLLLDL